jgi:uncharacterized damage-inducible protein DinB
VIENGQFRFRIHAFGSRSVIDNKEVVLIAAGGSLRAYLFEQEDVRMQDFPKYLFCTFRAVVRLVVLAGIVVSGPPNLASAQISPDLPNPTNAPNPLTTTLSIFRRNMQEKITKAADKMPESKYSYRPTNDVRSFGEIVTHLADISYILCSNAKGEAPPAPAGTKASKPEIVAYLKGAFAYCDGVYSGFTDAHLNATADFFGFKTNKMFLLTQVGNHDALHNGNLVTYLRINDLEPSGGWF